MPYNKACLTNPSLLSAIMSGGMLTQIKTTEHRQWFSVQDKWKKLQCQLSNDHFVQRSGRYNLCTDKC